MADLPPVPAQEMQPAILHRFEREDALRFAPDGKAQDGPARLGEFGEVDLQRQCSPVELVFFPASRRCGGYEPYLPERRASSCRHPAPDGERSCACVRRGAGDTDIVAIGRSNLRCHRNAYARDRRLQADRASIESELRSGCHACSLAPIGSSSNACRGVVPAMYSSSARSGRHCARLRLPCLGSCPYDQTMSARGVFVNPYSAVGLVALRMGWRSCNSGRIEGPGHWR